MYARSDLACHWDVMFEIAQSLNIERSPLEIPYVSVLHKLEDKSHHLNENEKWELREIHMWRTGMEHTHSTCINYVLACLVK